MTANRVAIVGGGLAAMAAAVALAQRGVAVELFEARRRLGGRAASFDDPATGEKVDHCQHVSMGCCTNLADFARRVGIAHLFRRYRTLSFIDPKGRRSDFTAKTLPAPLHLAPGLMALKYLSASERFSIARTMLKLARTTTSGADEGPVIGQWLSDHGQSARAIELFWSVVLTSALGETVDRAGVHYARKVFVDAFLSHRSGYVVEVPTVSLDELYGMRLERCLVNLGVGIHLSCPVAALLGDGTGVRGIQLRNGTARQFDAVIVATAWRKAAALLRTLDSAAAMADSLDRLQSSPITGVHLWFDRPMGDLDHAVLVGRLSQWLFRRQWKGESAESQSGYYYQVVISGSRDVATTSRDAIVGQVVEELREAFPVGRDACLIQARLVTDPEAVFSPVPGVDRWRPAQRTPVANLFLAGDWTMTGWPSTMEGAVRGGYLAAEALLNQGGATEKIVVADLKRSLLARRLLSDRGGG
jgi:squalene-associated FAD-dependent desaturase